MANEKVNGYNIAKPLVLTFYDKEYVALPSIDAKYGPYLNRTECLRVLTTSIRAIGLTVGIKNDQGLIDEYWFEGGITDDHLKLKVKSSQAESLINVVVDIQALKDQVQKISDTLKTVDTNTEISPEQQQAIVEKVMQAINTSDKKNALDLIEEVKKIVRDYVNELIRTGQLTAGSSTQSSGISESRVSQLITEAIANSVEAKLVKASSIADVINELTTKNKLDPDKIKAEQGIVNLLTDIITTDNASTNADVLKFVNALVAKLNGKVDAKPGTGGTTSTTATVAEPDQAFVKKILDELFSNIDSNADTEEQYIHNKFAELIDFMSPFSSKRIISSAFAFRVFYSDDDFSLNKYFNDNVRNTNRSVGWGAAHFLLFTNYKKTEANNPPEDAAPTLSFMSNNCIFVIDMRDGDSNHFVITEYEPKYPSGTGDAVLSKKNTFSYDWGSIISSAYRNTVPGAASTSENKSIVTSVDIISYTQDDGLIRSMRDGASVSIDLTKYAPAKENHTYVVSGEILIIDEHDDDNIKCGNFHIYSGGYTHTTVPLDKIHVVKIQNDTDNYLETSAIRIKQVADRGNSLPGKFEINGLGNAKAVLLRGVIIVQTPRV